MSAAYQAQYKHRLDDAGFDPLTSIEQTKATFGEGAAASFHYMMDEGTSTSAIRAYQPYLDTRDDEIEKLTGKRPVLPFGSMREPWYADAAELVTSGELGLTDGKLDARSPRAVGMTKRINNDYLHSLAIREQLRRENPESILSDAQIADKVKEELGAKRKVNQSVMARASGMSQFVGTAAGALTDPTVIATLPLGLEWQGGKALVNAARAFGSEFAIGAGTEALIQADVYEFKKAIDSPYTKAEALLNVLAAGVGAGVLRATVGAGIDAGVALRRAFAEKGATEALIKAGIDPVIATRILDEVETRAASRPPDVSLRDHSDAIDAAVESVSAGRLADEPGLDAARHAEDQATVIEAKRFLDERIAELTPEAGNRLDRGTRKAFEAEIESVRQRLNEVSSESRLNDLIDAEKAAGATGRKAKAAATKAQEKEVSAVGKELDERLKKLEQDNVARKAESELSRLEQGKIKDPVKTATKLGFNDPTPLRKAIRNIVDEGRERVTPGRPFDPARAEAELLAQRVAGDTHLPKPKVEKGAVPEALRPPTVEKKVAAPEPNPPHTAGPGAGIPKVPVLTVVRASDELPDIPVAVGIRADGSLDTRQVKEVLADLDNDLSALDLVDSCMKKAA